MKDFKIRRRKEIVLGEEKQKVVDRLLNELFDLNDPNVVTNHQTVNDENGSHPMTFTELQEFNTDRLYMLCDYLGRDEAYMTRGTENEPDKQEGTQRDN